MQIDNKDGGQEVEAPYRWMWEEDLIKSGRWSEQYDDERPAEHPQVRNIRPLYTRPQPASTALVDTAHDLISDWLQEGVEDLPDDTPVNVNIGGRLIIHNKLGELRSALSASQSTEGK